MTRKRSPAEEASVQRLARALKALGNENRLALYREIARNQEATVDTGGCLISKIIKAFKVSAPTISHHLKELVAAELVVTERRGKFLVARINGETVEALQTLLAEVSP